MTITPRFRIIALVGLLAIIVALNTFLYTMQQVQESWFFVIEDQVRIASMFQTLTKPDTFARDLLFSNGEYFKFYTPSYFALLAIFTQDGADVWQSFGIIISVILLLYVPSATLFFWVLCRQWAISAIFAIISTVGFVRYGDFWEVYDLSSALPRSVATPTILLVLAGLFAVGKSDRLRRPILLYGLIGSGIGAFANLHPASGVGMASAVGLLLLMWHIRTKNANLIALVVYGIMVLVCGSPILLNVVSNSSFNSVSQPRDLSQIWEHLYNPWGSDWSTVYAFVRVGWFVVSLVLWLKAKPNTIWEATFCGLQLVMVAIVARNHSEVIIVAGLALVWYCHQSRSLSSLLIQFEWLACILFVCQVFPVIVYIILPTQSSAYTWSIELVRSARFLNVAFFGLLATAIAQEEQKRAFTPAMLWVVGACMAILYEWVLIVPLVILWAVQHFSIWLNYTWLRILWTSAVASVGTLIVLRSAFSLYFGYCVLIALITGGVAFAIQVLARLTKIPMRNQQAIVFVTPIVSLVISVMLRQNPTQLHKILAEQLLFAPAVALLIGAGVLFIYQYGTLNSRQLFGAFLAVMIGQTVLGLVYQRYNFVSPEVPAYIQAAQWAKANTPPNSLIYHVQVPVGTSDHTLQFRLFSLRSLSHNMSEPSLYTYARPEDVPIFEQRHAEQIASYQNAESLIAMAQQYNADYILIDTNFLGYTLDLPIAFSQENIIVYSLMPLGSVQ
jgi:hypothetical protein